MNTIDILKFGEGTWQAAIEKFPREYIEQSGACGWWSVKDLLSHLVASEQLTGDAISNILHGTEIAAISGWKEHGGDYNDHEVRRRQHLSADTILQEHAEMHARTLALAAEMPAEKFAENGTMPWYGESYCVNDLIVFVNYAHKREHAAHIDAMRDRVTEQ